MEEMSNIKRIYLKCLLVIIKALSYLSYWAVIFVYGAILIGGLMYILVCKPENWLTRFMDEHETLCIIIFFALMVLYLPFYLMVRYLINKLDKKICRYISDVEGITPEEMLEIAERYRLDNMFQVALDKRLKELGITEVPRCCTDGREIFRLPTKDDLGKDEPLITFPSKCEMEFYLYDKKVCALGEMGYNIFLADIRTAKWKVNGEPLTNKEIEDSINYLKTQKDCKLTIYIEE